MSFPFIFFFSAPLKVFFFAQWPFKFELTAESIQKLTIIHTYIHTTLIYVYTYFNYVQVDSVCTYIHIFFLILPKNSLNQIYFFIKLKIVHIENLLFHLLDANHVVLHCLLFPEYILLIVLTLYIVYVKYILYSILIRKSTFNWILPHLNLTNSAMWYIYVHTYV